MNHKMERDIEENAMEICISPASSSPMSPETSSDTEAPNQISGSFQNRYPMKKFADVGLRSIDEIPDQFRHIFSMYPSFNAFQSKVFDDIFYSNKPVIISAPTGSGKTVIFELAIIKLLINILNFKYRENFIIVYMAPIKALCAERLQDWQYKFSPLGLKCEEITGDSDPTLYGNISSCHIVLTTPEKWDSLTRTWKDKETMQTIKLFLLDEIHIINDEQRGPVLEAVVSRMKTLHAALNFSESSENKSEGRPSLSIRFVAVSATIPNIEDVAFWLGENNSPAQYYSLGDEYRPVKLNKVVKGYSCPQHLTTYCFEMHLSYKLRQLILQYSEGKPSLIFCSTRKGVQQTADILIKQLTFHFNEEQKTKLALALERISENAIKKCVAAGVGCHHAGMDLNDRRVMEDLFRSGGLPVLITTSTLAMGVNLPAHLVILKSTKQYTANGYQEYSPNQVLQMIGRAGRPQYDTHATAIIMTNEDTVSKYERLVAGTDTLESKLHHHLAEHLNAEVVLSTITEKTDAINWIRSTFLYVRALRNPKHYGISPNLTKKGIEDKLQEMCIIQMNALASAQLVKMNNSEVWPTDTGILMAQHYMSFETMKMFQKITGTEKVIDMLKILTNCHELRDCKLRVSEKRALNFLNKTIRFPYKENIKTTQMKINCLIQAMFGGLVVQEPSLQQETVQIVRIGIRITKCLTRYLSLQDKYQSLLSATILSKCFQCSLWEDSPFVSRQLEGIGAVLSQLLVSAGKTSFQSIAESNPRDLERIINRTPPMGNRLQNAALHMPQYNLQITEDSQSTVNKLTISVRLVNYEAIKNFSTPGFDHNLVIIAGDVNNKLLLYTKFQDILLINNEGTYSWLIEVTKAESPKIFVNLISESWVGMDVKTSLDPEVTFLNEKCIENQISSTNQNHTSTPPQSSNSEVHNIKIIGKKSKQIKSSVQQLLKSSMNNIHIRKKLTLNVQKKQIQNNLKKYFFQPKQKIKLSSVPHEEKKSTHLISNNDTAILKENGSHTNESNSNEQYTKMLLPRMSQSNNSNEESQIKEKSQHLISVHKKKYKTLTSPQEQEIQIFNTEETKIFNDREQNNKATSKVNTTNYSPQDDFILFDGVGDEKSEITTRSLLYKGKSLSELYKGDKNGEKILAARNKILPESNNILTKPTLDTTKENLKKKNVTPNSFETAENSCNVQANIIGLRNFNKDINSKYYPIFVKALSQGEIPSDGKEHKSYSGKETTNNNKTPTKVSKTSVNFDLGIESLLENEEQEFDRKKSLSKAANKKLPLKPKQLDFKNPVTRLLYGKQYMNAIPLGKENINTNKTLSTHISYSPPLSLPLSSDYGDKSLPWIHTGHSSDIPIDHDTTFKRSDFLSIASPFHNSYSHQKCTLDAFEFLQNSNQNYGSSHDLFCNIKPHSSQEQSDIIPEQPCSQMIDMTLPSSLFDIFSD